MSRYESYDYFIPLKDPDFRLSDTQKDDLCLGYSQACYRLINTHLVTDDHKQSARDHLLATPLPAFFHRFEDYVTAVSQVLRDQANERQDVLREIRLSSGVHAIYVEGNLIIYVPDHGNVEQVKKSIEARLKCICEEWFWHFLNERELTNSYPRLIEVLRANLHQRSENKRALLSQINKVQRQITLVNHCLKAVLVCLPVGMIMANPFVITNAFASLVALGMAAKKRNSQVQELVRTYKEIQNQSLLKYPFEYQPDD